jgi:uncharacterized protein
MAIRGRVPSAIKSVESFACRGRLRGVRIAHISTIKEGRIMIEIRESHLGKAVHATQPIEQGKIVIRGRGQRVSRRTRHSIQVDHDRHVVIDSCGTFLNHSCEPNCGVMIRRGSDLIEFHTLRPIMAGEELTIDYATFELEIHFMDGPCQCGAPSCRGRISGYKELPEERRAVLAHYIAEYLLESDVVVSQAG